MFSDLLSIAVLAALATLGTVVDAHGLILNPRIEFKPGTSNYDAPAGMVDGYQALPPTGGLSYSGTPDSNAKAFATAFHASQYKSLREIAQKNFDRRYYDPKCGDSRLGTPQVLPPQVKFGFREFNIGFFSDHQGPCEIWCDDQRVMADDNCAMKYKQPPGAKGSVKIEYDRAKCANAKVFAFYWMAVHLPRWQIYINCAAIQSSGTPMPTSTTTPKSNTSTPMPMPMPTNGTMTKSPTPGPMPTSTPTPVPSSTKKMQCQKKNKRVRN